MSDETFAELFCVSASTISRALKSLEQKNYIIRDTKNSNGGKERHIYITNNQNDACIPPPTVKMTFPQEAK